jgi:hypothetical protein
MDIEDVVPPGEHRHDPYKKDLDPVTWAVARALCHIDWIGEHWYSFQKDRDLRPELAEAELEYLIDSQRQARKHLERLAGLLLAGYTRDPMKRADSGLMQHLSRLDASAQVLRPRGEQAGDSSG